MAYEWPPDALDEQGKRIMPLVVALQPGKLAERDPEGRSLFAAKLRFVEKEKEQGNAGADRVKMSAEGPAEDEFMSIASINLVHEYVNSGCLDCPPELEGDGARPLC